MMPKSRKKENNIKIPHLYTPRPYQIPPFVALEKGCRRFVFVWHRRAGKSLTSLQLATLFLMQNPGSCFHFYPTSVQARTMMWDASDKTGMKHMTHFPGEIVEDRNETHMRIRLKNGSLYQLMGADNKLDNARGGGPKVVIFSEWSYCDPDIWRALMPAFAESGHDGLVIFDYTPNGNNHGKATYEYASGRDDWFCSKLDVEQTMDIGGNRIVEQSAIQEAIDTGETDEFIQQEYYCSFDGFKEGSYYGAKMRDAESEGRIGDYPWERELPVYTAWDIGRGDKTAIWFFQLLGRRIRFIHYVEDTLKDLPYWANMLLKELPYLYDTHYMPWDICVTDYGTGHSRYSRAMDLGFKNIHTVDKLSVEDGIESVRNILPRCEFDRKGCKRGIEVMQAYSKKWNKTRKEYEDTAYKDWSSDGADAFRMCALGLRPAGHETRLDLMSLKANNWRRKPRHTNHAHGWLR